MNEVTIAFAVVGGVIGFWALLVWVCKRRESAPQREAADETADYAELALADLQRHPRPVYYGTPGFWARGPYFFRITALVGDAGGETMVRIEYTEDPQRLFLPHIVSADDWGRFIAGREPVKFYGTPAPTSATVETGPWPIQNAVPPIATPDLPALVWAYFARRQRRLALAQQRNQVFPPPGYTPGIFYFGRFHSTRPLAAELPSEPLYWMEGTRGPGHTMTVAFARGPLGPWVKQIVEKTEWDRFVADHADRKQNERDSIPYRPRGGPDA